MWYDPTLTSWPGLNHTYVCNKGAPLAWLQIYLIARLKLVTLYLCTIICVAFVTLGERKLLRYIQKRKGPIKAGYKGALQPFRDAVKLLLKERVQPSTSNFLLYTISPAFALLISLILWLTVPSFLGRVEIRLSLVFILCCLSARAYPVLIAG